MHVTVAPGQPVDLASMPTQIEPTPDIKATRKRLRKVLSRWQERLFAEHKQRLLVILQGLDTSGKDGAIRSVFRDCNIGGVHVWRFLKPTRRERERDFLWRAHKVVPPDGIIGVWNRSHYEGVLVERVKHLTPEDIWRPRFDQINDFERMLHESGTRIVKIFLHISSEVQRRRLQPRLDRPDKHWKFEPDDLVQRGLWDDYHVAYEECLARTSTPHAMWHVVPADDKRSRDVAILRLLEVAFEEMDPQYPRPDGLPKTID